jgi:hypothetical protein
MARYNWEEIKAKYETGKYSMHQLAEEYGFNESYAARKARKNGWVKGRSTEKVQKEAAKKVREEEAGKEAKLRLEYEKLINNTRRGAYNALMNEKNFDRLKQFKIFSEILRNCRKEQWEVNEILETADKKLIVNQEDKLEMFVNGVESADVIEDG